MSEPAPLRQKPSNRPNAISNSLKLLPLMLLVGCSSVGPDGQPVPRYGTRLNVTTYSTTQRPPTAELDVYEPGQELPPHRIIAMISREGHHRDEGLVMNAIVWKARMLGADAIVRLPMRDRTTEYSGTRIKEFATAKTETEQPVWRVNAIIYTQPSTTPTASKPAPPELNH